MFSLIAVGVAQVDDVASSDRVGCGQQRSIGSAYVACCEGPADASGSDRTRFTARCLGVGAGHLHRAGLRTFAALVTGLIAQTGRCTVTGVLTGAGLPRAWSHDRAHAFFSRARWNPDILGISLSHLIVRRLLPEGAVLTVAVDDTLFERRGKKVFGAAWQHDGAARGPRPVGRGTCFVVGLVAELPFLAQPVCLPVMARLWRPGRRRARWPWRHPCSGSWPPATTAGASTSSRTPPTTGGPCATCPPSAPSPPGCPPPRSCTTSPRRAPAGAAAPPSRVIAWAPRRTSRPPPSSHSFEVTRYQRTDTARLAEIACRWDGSFHTRTVRVILLRDHDTTAGYDLALVTTDLATTAADLITRYAWRWSIEVTFAKAREVLARCGHDSGTGLHRGPSRGTTA
ncbi:transposase [Streptomyces pratens]|uniref:Transposase n=1 Tax=Streptomyces pratens TaxID=887456 RepID=A0ABW1M926_9ACTN